MISTIGEVYEVDDDLLKHLDNLEGVPVRYTRTPIALDGANELGDRPIWAYFKTTIEDELLGLEMLADYPLDNRYVPPS